MYLKSCFGADRSKIHVNLVLSWMFMKLLNSVMSTELFKP